jgi:hypothetical protein
VNAERGQAADQSRRNIVNPALCQFSAGRSSRCLKDLPTASSGPKKARLRAQETGWRGKGMGSAAPARGPSRPAPAIRPAIHSALRRGAASFARTEIGEQRCRERVNDSAGQGARPRLRVLAPSCGGGRRKGPQVLKEESPKAVHPRSPGFQTRSRRIGNKNALDDRRFR